MFLGTEKINITDNLDFFARQVVEGFLTGLHKSPYHGFSVEFAEHRTYNQGDPVKNVDWKLFARSDKLFIKKYEEETNLRCHLLLDISSSMLYPQNSSFSKMSFSIYATACLIYLLQKQRDAFGLTYFSDKIDFFSKTKSNKSHYNRLLVELDKLLKTSSKTKNKTNFIKIIPELVEKIHQRSLIIIFSDMMSFNQEEEKIFETLQYLRYKKNEVVLFHVRDSKTEQLFEFPNQPYTFIDLENDTDIKLNPMNFKEVYTKMYMDFQKKMETKCNQYKIDYIPTSIEDGFSRVLLSYLTKRSKLF